jgi:hypothetical protein
MLVFIQIDLGKASEMANDTKYGVLMYDEAWKELGKAVAPYFHEGDIGKYIYCKDIVHLGHFVELTITPSQVSEKIKSEMKIQIPCKYIKFITYGSETDQKNIGFTR